MIEMDADAADVGLTVHPHPTLSETPPSRGRGGREGTITASLRTEEADEGENSQRRLVGFTAEVLVEQAMKHRPSGRPARTTSPRSELHRRAS